MLAMLSECFIRMFHAVCYIGRPYQRMIQASVCLRVRVSSVRMNRGGGGRARGGYGYSYWFPALRKNA